MASIKKIKTSNQFSSNKQSNYFKDNSYNSENIKNNEENQINSNYIEKSFLEDLLKCELCDNIFDLNIHTPIVIKCGHTFCKNCVLNIYNNKNKEINNSCPFDNVPNAFNLESCLINLRVQLLIKKIFYKENNNKNQKKIVYSKPDVKKVNQNVLSNEAHSSKKSGEYGYKKYEEINDNLNTPQIEDEINMINKLPFEDEKIKGVMINETIDTIPLYDEKSFENVSFKEDVNELFEKKNIITNKKPIIPESIKREINKNKYTPNNNKRKDEEPKIKINNKKVIKPLTKLVPDLSLTPKKIKESKISKEIPLENNYNFTDRNINPNEYIKRQIILEHNNAIKNNNIKIPELNKLIKSQKKLKENDDIIVLNKKEEEKTNKDLYLDIKNNYPSKKIILFSSTNNNNKDGKDYNFNKLNTIQNLESNEKKLKMSLILNKNANILSTQILKNTTNTIEAKNNDYEQLIKSTNKRQKKIGRNYNDNDNEAFTKNRTFNCKNEENNSLLDLLDNSNKENKNNDLNKNIKILNKSNNNSSSYSNSNSNSVYNKKKVRNENSINKKDNSQENSNYHKLYSINTKSQNLLSIENLKKINLNKEALKNDDIKLRYNNRFKK